MNIHSVSRAKQGSQKIKYLSESTRAESKKSKDTEEQMNADV